MLARLAAATSRAQAIAAVEPAGAAGGCSDADGSVVAEADIVCLAAGAEPGGALAGRADPAGARPAELGATASPRRPPRPGAPTWRRRRDGLLFGATHDRGDAAADWRADDDARNLAALAARLPQLAGAARRRARSTAAPRCGRRRPTACRSPAPLAPGLFVLGGLGARGFALAPLLAEHVAAEALGAPSPLPQPLARVVDPGRFAERARRRGVAQPARTV